MKAGNQNLFVGSETEGTIHPVCNDAVQEKFCRGQLARAQFVFQALNLNIIQPATAVLRLHVKQRQTRGTLQHFMIHVLIRTHFDSGSVKLTTIDRM